MPEFDEDVWVAALDDRLDALPDSPTSTDVMHVTDDYEASTGVAVAVRRALEGGGSPDLWTPPRTTEIQAGDAGLFTDAISADTFGQRVLYQRVAANEGATTELRCYDFQAETDTLLATDNANVAHPRVSAEAAIDGSDRLAYPTESGTVKVIQFDGTVICESDPVAVAQAQWVCWQWDEPFDTAAAVLAVGDFGGGAAKIWSIDPATGDATQIVAAGTPAALRCSDQSRQIAYFDDDVLTVAEPDGSNPTPVDGAPAADSDGRPSWAFDGADFIYYVTDAGGIERIKADGTGAEVLVAAVASVSIESLRVLADGTYMAFVRSRSVPSREMVMVASGRVPDSGVQIVPAVAGEAVAYSPAWVKGSSPYPLAFGHRFPPSNFDGLSIVELTV